MTTILQIVYGMTFFCANCCTISLSLQVVVVTNKSKSAHLSNKLNTRTMFPAFLQQKHWHCCTRNDLFFLCAPGRFLASHLKLKIYHGGWPTWLGVSWCTAWWSSQPWLWCTYDIVNHNYNALWCQLHRQLEPTFKCQDKERIERNDASKQQLVN